MNPAAAVMWEGRLTRLSSRLLALAVLYGVIAGTVVTMYYDLTPDMSAIEDSLASPQFLLFLLAIILGLTHLPFAAADLARGRWGPAAIRAIVAIGPILVFLGTDGLLAHLLWWGPISDTDRFHILHHSVFAGIPLALGFGLLARVVWRPTLLRETPVLSWGFWLASGAALLMIVAPIGILFGVVDPILVAGIEILGLLGLVTLLAIGRMKR
jgi:hypothetical protein